MIRSVLTGGWAWTSRFEYRVCHASFARWIVVGPGARLTPYGSRAAIGEAVGVSSTLLRNGKLAMPLSR